MIGVTAPISLSVLRLIQGIALGGEWGGASLMVSEIDPEGRRRGFYGSMVQVASPVGYLLAYGMFTVVTYSVSPEAFLDWGWRVSCQCRFDNHRLLHPPQRIESR
jgi:MFS family permease